MPHQSWKIFAHLAAHPGSKDQHKNYYRLRRIQSRDLPDRRLENDLDHRL